MVLKTGLQAEENICQSTMHSESAVNIFTNICARDTCFFQGSPSNIKPHIRSVVFILNISLPEREPIIIISMNATEEASYDILYTQSTFNDGIPCELDHIYCNPFNDPYTVQCSDKSSDENIS